MVTRIYFGAHIFHVERRLKAMKREIKCVSKYFITTSSIARNRWKTICINGKETHLEIRRDGTIRNKYTEKVFSRFHQTKTNCFTFSFRFNGGSYVFVISRVLACIFIPIPKKYIKMGYSQQDLFVTAKDGNLCNLDLDNLMWITPSEKRSSERKIGIGPVGEGHPRATITNDTARKICEMLQEGKQNKEIYDSLEIPEWIVTSIKGRKTWKQISKDYKW